MPPNSPGAESPLPPAYRGETQRQGSTSTVLGAGGLISPGRARITADLGSNSLIVVAEPEVQQVYGELIRQLDHRRPQVLIEATVVVLNTSDTFSLGVEISGGDGVGPKRLISFSSFGLSTVDPVTGALALIPGLGYNGTLVDPDVATIINAGAAHLEGFGSLFGVARAKGEIFKGLAQVPAAHGRILDGQPSNGAARGRCHSQPP